jgi:hypothetical protein
MFVGLELSFKGARKESSPTSSNNTTPPPQKSTKEPETSPSKPTTQKDVKKSFGSRNNSERYRRRNTRSLIFNAQTTAEQLVTSEAELQVLISILYVKTRKMTVT